MEEFSIPSSIIALVDDDPLEARLVEHGLRKVGQHSQFVHFSSGQQFLDFLDSPDCQHISLVLLDLKMPSMDGWEVLKNFARKEKHGIPIVIFSSSAHPQDVALSYELGASGYVTKPILRDEYLKTLKSMTDFWVNLNRRNHT